jgi:hypothetical protein
MSMPSPSLGRRVRLTLALAACLALGQIQAQVPAPAGGGTFPVISEQDLETWLSFLASDELAGRQVFTEGYGIAAQYIAERLREFGVKPLGDGGSYFQIVKLQSYDVTRRSFVTIEARGRSRTFQDGDHVAFPAAAGGRQTLVFEGNDIVSVQRPGGGAGTDVQGKLLVLLTASAGRSLRGAEALQAVGAGAGIELVSTMPVERRSRGDDEQADIPATPRRIDALSAPRVMADDVFFQALLSAAGTSLADFRAQAARDSGATLAGVKVTIQVDNSYTPVTTRLTRNVIGLVEGADARLKDSYVLFGAHLDHVGYATTSRDVRGRVNGSIDGDRIWNGADDNGSGTTAQLAIAKAFATGPRPRRSALFVWHSGEEANLYGSRYHADFPAVPLETVQAHLNIDMIGRNRDNDPAQSETVFVIGADRISTDLHNLVVDTNQSLPNPLRLDYEYNDPADPNSFYTRSDHYSYASKGIPIAFFFTGEHPDYHANTDSADKIQFDKQARIAQLVYRIGFALADSEQELRRDRQGPRAGRGFRGRLD